MTADYLDHPTIRVSLILIDKRDRILLAQHVKEGREYWVLPGGHLDKGETIQECAIRELKEETSLDGEFDRVVFLSESIDPSGRRHIINIYALVTVAEGSEDKLKICSDFDILKKLEYMPLSEITEMTVYPAIQREIISAHQREWANPNIQVIETPWN